MRPGARLLTACGDVGSQTKGAEKAKDGGGDPGAKAEGTTGKNIDLEDSRAAALAAVPLSPLEELEKKMLHKQLVRGRGLHSPQPPQNEICNPVP